MKKSLLLLIPLMLIGLIARAISNTYFVDDLALDPLNKGSLQRGAQIYFNYCRGCHSLRYERYNHMADFIGIKNQRHQLYDDLIQKTMLFDPHANINQPIQSAIAPEDAKKWFGVEPPDLTNITLIRSPAWVYNFLRGFYKDETRPNGTNNLIAKNTAMPNILQPLRGETKPVLNNNQFDHFETIKAGQLKPLDFDRAMYDLVNFLDLAAEPEHIFRLWIGIAACAFLSILLMLIYFWYRTLSHQKTKDTP